MRGKKNEEKECERGREKGKKRKRLMREQDELNYD